MLRTASLRALALTLSFVLGASFASAKVVYVHQNTPGPAHDGTSWATAYLKVQQGLDAAAPGDEVWVAQGIYFEIVQLRNGVGLYGGFGGGESSRDLRSRDEHLTTIDGGQSGFVVTAGASVTQQATIDGFTVRNGRTTSSSIGGGIRSDRAKIAVVGTAVVSNMGHGISANGGDLLISGSTISRNGVPIEATECNVSLHDTTIYRNRGSTSLLNCESNVTRCHILENTSAGLVISGSASIRNCVIASNELSGVQDVQGSPSIISVTNCTIVGNGAGVSCVSDTYNDSFSLANCLVAFNQTHGLSRNSLKGGLDLDNNNIYGNYRENAIGNVGRWLSYGGNISEDPKLAQIGRNYHLQPGSPCIDAGSGGVATEMDIDGQPRIKGTATDIGADESYGELWPEMPHRIFHVSPDGNDLNDGTGWSSAKRTILAAADQASYGDEIWVSDGVYTGQTRLWAGIALYGGFTGVEAARSQRNWSRRATILDGARKDKVIVAPLDHNVVDGFTLRNGYSLFIDGAAIQCSGNDIRIANNLITGNEGSYIVRVEGRAIIVSNVITANVGNAVTIQGVSEVVDNIISDHPDDIALVCGTDTGRSKIRNNLIARNGAGVFSRNADILHCTIVYNTHPYNYNGINGLGVVADAGTSIVNTIVAFNSLGVGYSWYPPEPSIRNSCFFGNGTARYYSSGHVYDVPQSSGNRFADPQLLNAGAGNYRLASDSPCVNAGDDTVVSPDNVDLDGRPRKHGVHVDIGAYEFVPGLPLTTSLGAPMTTAPAISSGVVYAATSDGKLHARSLSDGSAVSGFPMDLASALGGTVTFNSRPAVYAGKTGEAVYLATQQGHVVKVSPTGKLLWDLKPLPGHTNSTPAVTPEGEVLVNLGWENDPPNALNFLFRMDESNGLPSALSPYLGTSTPDSPTDRSPAVYGTLAYINASGETYGGLVALNRHNLTVRAQFAPGEDALSPYVVGGNLYLATKKGNLYKLDAVTMNADLGFGSLGRVALNEEATAAPFGDASGTLYVGTKSGKVLAIDPNTGSRRVFHDSGTGQPVVGLVVVRTSGVLAYSTGDKLIQAPVNDATKAQVEALDGVVVGGLSYDAASGRFVLATAPGFIHAVPVL